MNNIKALNNLIFKLKKSLINENSIAKRETIAKEIDKLVLQRDLIITPCKFPNIKSCNGCTIYNTCKTPHKWYGRQLTLMP